LRSRRVPAGIACGSKEVTIFFVCFGGKAVKTNEIDNLLRYSGK
jgi:hypothetical protein